MTKIRTLGIIGTVATALALSACGGTPATSGSDPSGTKAETKTPAPDAGKTAADTTPINLVFYSPTRDWTEEYFMREFGDPIKTKFPYMTPKFIPYNGKADQLGEMIAAGDQVDLVMLSYGQIYSFLMKYGMQYDMTPLIQKNGYDMSVFEPSSVDILKQVGGGRLYGLPMYTLPSTIYYNKDLFDKFGVSYPTDKLTWDDLYELSKKLTRNEGGQDYYGTVISPSHLAMRSQLSLDLIDPKTGLSAINTSEWKTFMDNVSRFYQSYGWDSAAMQVAKQRDMFTKERRAAMWLPVSTMHTAEELEGMNWDLAAFPTLKEAPGVGPQPYPYYYFMSSTGKHKDQTFEVLTYLTSESFHMDKSKRGVFLSLLKNDAIRKAFGLEAEMYKGKNTKAMLPDKFAAPSYLSEYTASAASKIFGALVNVTTGKMDVNTALSTGNEEMNKAIGADKAK